MNVSLGHICCEKAKDRKSDKLGREGRGGFSNLKS
jgi:hypothetical protein